MYCTKCGEDMEEGSWFCPSCGETVSNNTSNRRNGFTPPPQQGNFNAQTANGGFVQAQQFNAQAQQFSQSSEEQFIPGIIGAAIGVALGLVVWCIIAKLGYISVLGGLALAAGGFYGYVLLAKSISKKGLAVVAVLVLAAVYIGVRLMYAMTICDAFAEYGIDVSVGEALKELSDYIELAELESTYIGDLVSSYLYTLLGSAVLAGSIIKRRRR